MITFRRGPCPRCALPGAPAPSSVTIALTAVAMVGALGTEPPLCGRETLTELRTGVNIGLWPES